jgi:hypothetical protein
MRDLYAIATDGTGESKMVAVDIAASSTAVQHDLGPRFGGGLTYRPTSRQFFALAQSGGAAPPDLVRLSGEGEVLSRVTLGVPLTGGLAYHAGQDALFAIENRPFPDLARVHKLTLDGTSTELFALDQLPFSGLVYESLRDRFYAIATDTSGFSWIYYFELTGHSQRLFGMAYRAAGGLTYAMHEDRFYFAANETSGTSYLHRLALSGQVDRLFALGGGFNGASLCVTPWFGGALHVTSPTHDARFVTQEAVRLDAQVFDVTGRPTWDSTGISWRSDRDGPLGTGTISPKLSVGPHTITAEGQGLSDTSPVRVFSDVWELYKAAPAQGEIDRVLRDFTINWVDGAAGDPTQQWASFPGFPFNQASADPSRMAVIAKLDVLRHQRFASQLPFSGAGESLYDYLRQHTHVLNVSLAGAANQAGGGVINLNRNFALWGSGPLAYVHNLYLIIHENQHNVPGDPAHTSCTGWDGSSNPPLGADAKFEPGSGYAAAALYLFWVYKYGLYDPPNIKDEAKLAANSLKGRFCAKPSSTDPRVQALLVELWGV